MDQPTNRIFHGMQRYSNWLSTTDWPMQENAPNIILMGLNKIQISTLILTLLHRIRILESHVFESYFHFSQIAKIA